MQRQNAMDEINKVKLECVDSTNNYAKKNILTLPLPSLITAEKQTAGRGRQGKSFYSPDKTGLYMTLAFEAPETCDLLTPAAAVAVCLELEELGAKPKIKWVNDVYIDGLKICGILAECFICGGKKHIALGIGINITTKDFPSDIPNPGSLNIALNKDELAEKIAKRFLLLTDKNFILKEYEKRLFVAGKTVGYEKNNESFTARVEGINEHCNLIVTRNDGTRDILSSGEISIKL